MRVLLAASFVVLVLGMGATALPQPSAVCAAGETCTVATHSFTSVPAVQVVESDATLVWESLDTTHVQAPGTGFGDGDPCFFVQVNTLAPSKAVTFSVTDDGLFATVDGTTQQCAEAQGDAAAGFVLPYQCVIHPQMRASLVVV